MTKKAVLIHGLHVEANGWDSLVWGDLAQNVWGSIPRGVEAAWRDQVELIFWGSGASSRDGKKEAEVMYERALSGIGELAALCDTSPEDLKAFLEARSVKDVDAKDTAAEIRDCFDLCLTRGIPSVVLIPYASQAPIASRRALGLALEDEKYASFRHHISLEPSDTRYAGTSMSDIVIFAPPHRGDRVSNPSHVLARKTLDVIQRLSKAGDADGIEKLLADWNSLLDR